MRAVVIRVARAALTIDGAPGPHMERGLLVLLGICNADGQKEVAYLAKKCSELRIFEDEAGKLNKSLSDVGGGLMVVSNFTLYADCARGRRPDFFGAAKPDVAIPLYQSFLQALRDTGLPVCHGTFGADMQIDHVNDGPVTLILDTAQMIKG